MEEKKNQNKPSVPPPVRGAPKVEIREQVKNIIDNLVPQLTQHEIQYVIAKIKQDVIQKSQIRASPAVLPNQQKPEVPVIDPVLQPILDDITRAEEEVTKGFTVSYPPKGLMPLGQETKEPDLLSVVQYAVDRLTQNPKVADGLGELLSALAKKVEGGK